MYFVSPPLWPWCIYASPNARTGRPCSELKNRNHRNNQTTEETYGTWRRSGQRARQWKHTELIGQRADDTYCRRVRRLLAKRNSHHHPIRAANKRRKGELHLERHGKPQKGYLRYWSRRRIWELGISAFVNRQPLERASEQVKCATELSVAKRFLSSYSTMPWQIRSRAGA